MIEQTIGRGLRLPYGKRTGVKAVDWLNIVAHDRFQEIIDEANREGSQLRLERLIIEPEARSERKRSIHIRANMERFLGDPEQAETQAPRASGAELERDVLASSLGAAAEAEPEGQLAEAAQPFATLQARAIAREVLRQIRSFEKRPEPAPSAQSLSAPSTLALLKAQVSDALRPTQGELYPDEQSIVGEIVRQTLLLYERNHIDIPTLTVQPSGEIRNGFHPFHLDLSQIEFMPESRSLLIRNLVSDQQVQIESGKGIRSERMEDYLVTPLTDFNDIDYFTQGELLYELAGQVVKHLEASHEEDKLHLILAREGKRLAAWIHEQMMPHFWEEAERYEVKVSRGFTALRDLQVTVDQDAKVRDLRATSKTEGETCQQIYGNFERCLYPLAKFDSDAERRFAISWCAQATAHNEKHQGKPWRYLLIPPLRFGTVNDWLS